jgi:hypothetical protein
VAAHEPDYLLWMLGAEEMDGEVLDVVHAELRIQARDSAPPASVPEG